MTIHTERAVGYLGNALGLDGKARAMCEGLIEYLNDWYDGPKPYDVLLKTLAAVGFTEEHLERMMADGIVEID